MNLRRPYEADDDDDEDDDIGEDLEDLKRACMVSKDNSASAEAGGGWTPSDLENEDEFEMLRNIKRQLASSSMDVDLCGNHPPMGLSDSENEDDFEMLRTIKSQVPSDSENEDDFEMLRRIKSQLTLAMEEDEDGAFETLRRPFSAYKKIDLEGNFMNGSEKEVDASDKREVLSRVEAGHLHENTSIEPPDLLETSFASAASSSFPESAQAFVDAVRRNRSYQVFLRRKLGEIEATIKQNEKHKKNVMIVKDFQASCKRITKQALSQSKDPRIELISARESGPPDSSKDNGKKTSPLTLGPPENHCVADYRMAQEQYSVSLVRTKWSTKENENLAKGLKQQFQETLILEATERYSDLEGSTDDINTILESVRNLEITPEMIRQFLPKVNWDQLDIKNRSAAECKSRWMSSEDPLINHASYWTAAEDDHIRLINKNKSFTDWLDVAVSLGTNRTPFQCLARYQRSLNKNILNSKWTAEEDDQLRDAVNLFGENDWQSVASVLKGRIGSQCSNRWKKSLHPTIEMKGSWSSEEEERLKIAFTLIGPKKWSKIAQFVPGRVGVQCSTKWETLDPNVKRGKWTEEEVAKLSEAVKEHGSKWAEVASHMSGRSRIQCSRKWKGLNPHLVVLKREASRLQREATVCNFVDRESERPDLVAGDFLPLAEISLEPEPALKKKRKARQKKADAECESEAFCADTERQPKRRRKGGLERCSGDVCRQENETEDNVKEKKQRRNRTSVAGTSHNSSVTTNCPRVNRRKVSALVPVEKQDAPN